jgi:predicted XRE-type DNA-binding protein
MKRTDPRWNDMSIIESSGNVFIDLGFDEAEAKVMALRAELIIRFSEWYEKTQLENGQCRRSE